MGNNNIKSTVISSLIWKLLERAGTQGIQFIVQIILARLLLPEEYGIIALVLVFIQLANVFVESGFNTALIQKGKVDEVDFSSVLYLSLVVATILYIIMYISAPILSSYYGQPLLAPVFRVLSLTLFIGAFNSIQNAFIARNMLFKRQFLSSLGAVIISGVIGIIAAYKGLGVWALVIQQLTNQLVVAIILWFTIKWRPILAFSIKRIKSLFTYGSKLLASGVLETLYNNLRILIIGKLHTPEMLGYYNRGQQFPQLIVTNINGSIQSVMLPTLSSYQDDKPRVKNIMRRAIVTSSFLIFPMMVGMAVVAEPLIKIVLTDKWLPAVPFMQVLCISFALWPIHTANLQAINALGRSDIFLRLEIVKKLVGIIILAISIPFGVFAIVLGELFNGIVGTFINAYPNRKLLNYSYAEQMKDIIPSFLISIVMGVVVYLISFINRPDWQILIMQVALGGFVYFVLSLIFKVESLTYLTTTCRQLICNKSRHKYSK